MTVYEISVGTVFKVSGKRDLWVKATDRHFRKLEERGWQVYFYGSVGDSKRVEVLRQPDTSPIRRTGDVLYLSDGDVQLEYLYPWLVRGATAEGKLTTFVLEGGTFEGSVADEPTEDTALPFTLIRGSQHLGRPPSSMIFAYKGRVYARATQAEVHGRKHKGGYKRVKVLDGAPRLIIAGLLTLPEEGALHDLIQDHFGPGAPYR